jgi:hypothetical protein
VSTSRPPRDTEPAGAQSWLRRKQVAARLGISPDTFRTRIRSGWYEPLFAFCGISAAENMITVGPGGTGSVTGWSERIVAVMAQAEDDPARLGDDPSSLPDDTLIGMAMWASLQGVTPGEVRSARSAAALRRAQGVADETSMPPEDLMLSRSPRWLLGTHRAWRRAVEARRAAGGQDAKGQWSTRARRV